MQIVDWDWFKDKILARVVTKDQCWLWPGANSGTGYGKVTYQKIQFGVHRVSYIMFFGSVKSGYELDHLCRNRSCLNPSHLEEVTHKENSQRGNMATNNHNVRKTHCPKGHLYTRFDARQQMRRCQKCDTLRQREIRSIQ